MAVGVIATLKIKPGKEADFEAVFQTLMAAVRANEPGNQVYQVCKSRTEGQTYVVMELYADDDALKAHGSSAHFAAAGPGLASCLDGRPDIKMFDAI